MLCDRLVGHKKEENPPLFPSPSRKEDFNTVFVFFLGERRTFRTFGSVALFLLVLSQLFSLILFPVLSASEGLEDSVDGEDRIVPPVRVFQSWKSPRWMYVQGERSTAEDDGWSSVENNVWLTAWNTTEILFRLVRKND